MAQTFRGSVCALDASDPHHVFNVFGGLGSSPRPQHQVFDLAFGFLSFANTVDELKRIVTGFLTTSSAITVNQRCLSPVTTENLHVPNPDQRRPTILADHVLAAAAYDGSIVEYATANSLKTKDLYQWKTALTKRGFLPLEKAEPATDFAEVRLTGAPAQRSIAVKSSVQCRLTLPCGSVLEYFSPADPETIARLLVGLRT